jgi:hypothetical protein
MEDPLTEFLIFKRDWERPNVVGRRDDHWDSYVTTNGKGNSNSGDAEDDGDDDPVDGVDERVEGGHEEEKVEASNHAPPSTNGLAATTDSKLIDHVFGQGTSTQLKGEQTRANVSHTERSIREMFDDSLLSQISILHNNFV